MRRLANILPLLLIALAAVTARAAAQETPESLYQAALYQEEVAGDLEAAIALYERILEIHPADPAVAARATLHTGLCYEKLGLDRAREAYRRVINDYPDQREEVAVARARLGSLERAAVAAAARETSSSIQVREVWSGPFSRPVDFSGGPTPDGRGLVYIDWQTGNLAVRDLATGEARQLTHDAYGGDPESEGYALQARVAPTGTLVAYVWFEPSGMQLRVVEMDGSEPRVLHRSSELWGLSWSSDGRHVATTAAAGDGAEAIIRISVDDGSMTTLDAFQDPDQISHSPDGRFLAVQHTVEIDSFRADIGLVPTSDGRPLPLVRHPADDRLIGWVPGTDAVLFTSDRTGSRDLFAVRVHEDGTVEEPVPIRRDVGELSPMGLTGDGSLFYFYYTLHYAKSVAPFDEATGRIDLSAAEPILGTHDNNAAAWSPTGDRLALVTREQEVGMPRGRGFAVRLRDLRSGAERILTRDLNPATVAGPRWLPDGRSILMVAQERKAAGRGWRQEAALYRIDVGSGDFERLLDYAPAESWWFSIGFVPTLAGDGLYYVHDGRLVLHRFADHQELELYRDPQLAAGTLALSPDGSELVFGVNDPDYDIGFTEPRLHEGGRLMVIPSRGGEARELVPLTGPGNSRRIRRPFFSSDGRHVLYFETADTGQTVVRVPRDGGEPERLWETNVRFVATPSPDRRRVTVMTQTNEAGIWVMENLVAFLKTDEER